ncbi:hypothetical protein SKAU_G00029000 [Synaphobranchus kaupii]|uniref:Uncharacterized protein n=1 Tax=Synaphobranchus kaupii TaxID=118154 RepID=A0A9Q1JFE7_SYNKA|nr:hypothetical protein SKAU_G00029000 [Synaphobranchus kaupii]
MAGTVYVFLLLQRNFHLFPFRTRNAGWALASLSVWTQDRSVNADPESRMRNTILPLKLKAFMMACEGMRVCRENARHVFCVGRPSRPCSGTIVAPTNPSALRKRRGAANKSGDRRLGAWLCRGAPETVRKMDGGGVPLGARL